MFVAPTPTSRTSNAVTARPRPGTARPTHCDTSGSVTPSITPKIETSAATLMMSGTVTKNPVMKRRRSQETMTRSAACRHEPHRNGHGQRDAVPREHGERVRGQVAQEILDGDVPDDRRHGDAEQEQLRCPVCERIPQDLQALVCGGRGDRR